MISAGVRPLPHPLGPGTEEGLPADLPKRSLHLTRKGAPRLQPGLQMPLLPPPDLALGLKEWGTYISLQHGGQKCLQDLNQRVKNNVDCLDVSGKDRELIKPGQVDRTAKWNTWE